MARETLNDLRKALNEEIERRHEAETELDTWLSELNSVRRMLRDRDIQIFEQGERIKRLIDHIDALGEAVHSLTRSK